MLSLGLMQRLNSPAQRCLQLLGRSRKRHDGDWPDPRVSKKGTVAFDAIDPYRVLHDCQQEIASRRNTPGPDIHRYASRYRRAELGYWQHIPRWMREDFADRPADARQLQCLDVGCAYGTLLLFAVKLLGCKPYAIDFVNFIDSSLVNDYDINYAINNLEREPFPWDTRFDVILFTEVIEHLNFNAVPTLKKLRGLLAPGGRLYLSTPDASQWGRQTKYYARYADVPFFSADAPRPVIDDHVWQFDETELKQVVNDAGFRIVRQDYAPGNRMRRFPFPGRRARHLNLTLAASP
jgi:SAM-dependent methyltransferase